MRPDAPHFPIIPPEDPDQTPADTPLAREVRAALRGPMAAFRYEFSEALIGLEGRLCEALVGSVSPRLSAIERRLDMVEAHLGLKTEPAPPPEGAE